MRLPLTVADISARWLEEALGACGSDVTVRSAEIVEVILGTSTKVRVAIDAGPDIPRSLIIKGGFEAHSVHMGPMYAAEARFYTQVQPRITMRSPRCFFAGTDPESHQSIVILEDLDLRNVTFLSPLRPLSFDAVARRLRAMAVYHAQTWNSPLFSQGEPWADIGSRFADWAMVYADRYLEEEIWDRYMRNPRGAAVSVSLHDRVWMRRALVQLGEIEREGPVCLIHGDTHLGNLYLESDGAPGFLDAQVCRASWSTEVAYHIVGALDLADRRAWERELVQVYLDALRAEGIEAPPLNIAFENYVQGIANGLFIFLINQTDFQSEAVNTAYAARFGVAAVDHELKARLG